MPAGRTWELLALVLVLAVSLVNTVVVRTSNQAPDDAYISLRYADNLASGHGLRFNPDGERVEGFSSPFHVLTMAAAIGAGADPLAVSQFSSLAPGLAVILIVAAWCMRRFGVVWGIVAGLSLALNPGFSFWTRGGMETTLFTLLILLALLAAEARRWRLMGLAAGLLAVTRPEGPIYLLPLFLHALVAIGSGKRTWKSLVVPGLLAVGPYVVWFLFRVIYFGDILPNTYYAKMDGLRLSQTARGLEYLASFTRSSEIQILLIVLGLGGVVYLGRLRKMSSERWPAGWPLTGLGLTACMAVFVLSSGGDWMNHHRFIQPILPVLALLGAGSAAYLARLARGARMRVVGTVIIVLVTLSQPVRIFSHDLRHPHYPLDRPLGLVEPWDDYNIPRLFKLGLKMRSLAPEGATFALCPVGSFSFAWGGTTIDMLGLNDREIAKLPLESMGEGSMGHEKGSGRVVLGRRPDFILLRGNPNPEGDSPAPPDHELQYLVPVIQIWDSPSFHADYEPFVVKVDATASYTVYKRVAGTQAGR
jgi:hypothetical protein